VSVHDSAEEAGSLRSYLTGFSLAAVLTAIPFWLVMGHSVAASRAAAIILALAAVQIVIHMVYFLHMNTRSEGGWNLLALLFTLMLVVIALSGSLWVMYHLNGNMMPASMKDMPGTPAMQGTPVTHGTPDMRGMPDMRSMP
jgi:cytochrome o ubiquinol oxidase operon protein cyoD